jgi:hypothetical protein
MNLKIFLIFIFIIGNTICKAFSQNIPEPIITHFFYLNHYYICFNGTQYIHDPDCACTQKFEGILEIKKHVYPITLYPSFILKNND